MILLIDAGNTRIKWALLQPGAPLGAWSASGAVRHADLAQLPQAWDASLGGRPITRALLSNVAGSALRARLQLILPAALPAEAVGWFASVARLAGVSNGYRTPSQLGCDRFAGAIAAHALAPGHAVIVANCGTATTIDALTPDGVFVGGMILPGLNLMTAALARNTAQLPQLPHMSQDGPQRAGFADNTDDAIANGCLAAQAGAIERAYALHGAEACLMTGGAAAAVAAVLKIPYRLVDNMVLIGLHAAIGEL
ncbi:type III pantothenate kinase [Rugamonas sp.]|uniref:type III pantothenate kinase n=1 Tax=Rugamonas sp. TaxID=1926287 RepID=UPI0025D93E55|nr:type III pantothenate kinase [Rugamonas sp.]